MAIDIVDAFQGKPHVTADDVGGFKAGIVGEEDYILPAGEQMKATVISNNKIRIAEGEAVMQGRHWRIKPNTYEDVTIENGAQNMNRKDAIIARYTKNADTGIEKVELAVLKGTPTSGTAIAPAQEKGNILEGTMKHEMLLYIVSLKGLNVESVTAEFDILMNMSEINKSLSDLIGGLTNAKTYKAELQTASGRRLNQTPTYELGEYFQIGKLVYVNINIKTRVDEDGEYAHVSLPVAPNTNGTGFYSLTIGECFELTAETPKYAFTRDTGEQQLSIVSDAGNTCKWSNKRKIGYLKISGWYKAK